MDKIPSPKDLRGAASVAQSLSYVAGLAGVIAGAVLFESGETVLAVVVWILTFAVGAILMIAAFLTRAMAAIMGRLARIESDVSVLVADRSGGQYERDPWIRHDHR